MVLLELQGLQHLDGEPSDQVLGNSLKVVVSNEFVEVDG